MLLVGLFDKLQYLINLARPKEVWMAPARKVDHAELAGRDSIDS